VRHNRKNELNARILVIDDDPNVLQMVEFMLVDLGYEVELAESGEKGVRLFCESAPDLVITDIIMPDREGIEIIIEMRRIRPDARIVAMSGVSPSALGMSAKLGADLTLAKPFNRDQLGGIVQTALARE
jgi:DNA-binding response OmpR family regulator